MEYGFFEIVQANYFYVQSTLGNEWTEKKTQLHYP